MDFKVTKNLNNTKRPNLKKKPINLMMWRLMVIFEMLVLWNNKGENRLQWVKEEIHSISQKN